MVRSVLNPEIDYEETRTVDKSDIGYDATQFEVELFPNIAAVIALGAIRYTFSDKNILYVPVYLINNGAVKDQIGVYEFLASQLTQLMDEDNDIDIDRLQSPIPLYYNFFTEKFLKTEQANSVITLSSGTPVRQTDEPVLDSDEEVEADEWTSPNKPTVLEDVLGEEGNEEKESETIKRLNREMREKEAYKPQKDDVWIKKFMRNGSYSLVDNEAGGDCLFAVIRDAFSSVGQEKSVASLRKIVSDAANETVLKNYKEHYDMYYAELSKLTARQLVLRDKLRVLEVQFETAPSRSEKLNISQKAKPLSEELNRTELEKKNAKELINEFKWMAGITTLAKLKAKIKTCKFWAEGWAINVLERVLNIKLIILSSENYRVGDVDNVLQCGDMVDEDIRKSGTFTPKYYIITSYRGDHYILITYNGTRIFDFSTLPNAVKQMVITKCMEDSSDKGIYNLIPDFQNFKDKELGPKGDAVPRTDSGAEDIDLPSKEPSDEGYKQMRNVKFDPEVVFQFYSKSSGKPKPGKGAGEKISKGKILEFTGLVNITDWRKVLSNFYITTKPFMVDGKQWTSVEHYYQGSKFRKKNPEFYATFSLDSGSDLSRSPEMAKGAGGKTGKYKGKQIRPKSIKIDAEFFDSGENERAMFKAQMAKYKSDALAKKVLMATKNAKLQHFVRGQPAIIFYDTMKIREMLGKD